MSDSFEFVMVFIKVDSAPSPAPSPTPSGSRWRSCAMCSRVAADCLHLLSAISGKMLKINMSLSSQVNQLFLYGWRIYPLSLSHLLQSSRLQWSGAPAMFFFFFFFWYQDDKRLINSSINSAIRATSFSARKDCDEAGHLLAEERRLFLCILTDVFIKSSNWFL